MKTIFKLLLGTIFSALFLNACTEKIDIELKGSYPRLVVEGSITTDTILQEIKLTTTAHYYDSSHTNYVSHAYVTISTDDTLMCLYENPVKPGHYYTQSAVAGKPFQTYTLRIDSVDINGDQVYEIYEATDYMAAANPLDSVKLALYEYYNFIEILIWATDPHTREWYAFKALINNRMVTDTITEVFLTDDELFNGRSTNGIGAQYLDLDENECALNENDTITFELNSISEPYFKFIMELQSEVFPQDPLFSGPPANISTNIRKINHNGPEAVGFFAAYSIVRKSCTYTNENIILNPLKK